MRISDVRKAISTLLYDKLKIAVNVEWVEGLEGPTLTLEMIENRNTTLGVDRVLKEISWVIKYYPNSNFSANKEIQEKLDDIDLVFDMKGKKILKVLDRYVTLMNTTTRIVDNIGNFVFDTEIVVGYGEQEIFKKMERLEIRSIKRTHKELRKFQHLSLRKYTHKQLRDREIIIKV